MATILKKTNKDGSCSWRMIIRRKGIPALCKSFFSEEEAKEWVKQNEEAFIQNPIEILLHERETRLQDRRNLEFKRKKAGNV